MVEHRSAEVRFLIGTQNLLSSTLVTRQKNIFLYFFTELKTYHLSYFYLQTLRYRHCWSWQYAGHVSYELRNRPRSPQSLWLSGRASERGIRRSEVRFLMETQNFILVPRSWQDEKTYLSLFLYRAQNLPSLLILSTNIMLSTLLILAVYRTRVIWTY